MNPILPLFEEAGGVNQHNGTAAEVRELPSGFWAVFIDGNFVDAASSSKEEAQAKLNLFLRRNQNGRKEKVK